MFTERIRALRVLFAWVLATMLALLPARGGSIGLGEAFPALSEFALEGKLPAPAEARVVVVDFWASWCPPCRDAFPLLDALQRELGPRGLRVIAVSVDQKRGEMEAFLKRHPVAFTVVRDAEMRLARRVEVPGMPTTFVLDARGRVRFVHTGFEGEQTGDRLRAAITALLEEDP